MLGSLRILWAAFDNILDKAGPSMKILQRRQLRCVLSSVTVLQQKNKGIFLERDRTKGEGGGFEVTNTQSQLPLLEAS